MLAYPPRVTFRKGETKRLMFLDGDPANSPVWFIEHRKQINGHWVYPVCQNSDIYLAEPLGLRRKVEMAECYACDHGSNRYTVGALSVIDVGGFLGRDERMVKGIRNVYAGDIDSCGELGLIAAENGGTLRGCVIDITEMAQDFGGCGTNFHMVKYIPQDRWPDAQVKLGSDIERYPWEEFDYMAFTRPMTNEDMRRLWIGEHLPDPLADGEILYT